MAFVPLQPTQLNANVQQGLSQEYQSAPVVDFSNTAVDLSGWFAYQAQAISPAPNPNGAAVAFGTVTANSSGVISLLVGAADLAGLAPGNAKIVISAKKLTGDNYQTLSTGTLTLNAID